MNNHKNATLKLPKQWMYWAKKDGLRREFGHGNGHGKQGVHFPAI